MGYSMGCRARSNNPHYEHDRCPIAPQREEMIIASNKGFQGTLHKVSGPLNPDVGAKEKYDHNQI